MNLSNLLASSANPPGLSNQPPHASLAGAKFPVHSQVLPGMNPQQFPTNLPRIPGLMQQQQLLGIPSLNMQQLTAGGAAMADRQRNSDAPSSKKPKLYV